MKLTIEAGRLDRELHALGAISAEPAPVVTRVVYTEADVRARQFVGSALPKRPATSMYARDPISSNTFHAAGKVPIRISRPSRPALTSTPFRTRDFSMAASEFWRGIEAIRALQRAGFRPRRSIDLVIFTSRSNPTRFGIGCFGSRMMSGRTLPHRRARCCAWMRMGTSRWTKLGAQRDLQR